MVRALLGKFTAAFKNEDDAGFRNLFLAPSLVLPNDRTSLSTPATYCGWLKRVCICAPNSKFNRSVKLNRFTTLTSTLSIGGSLRALRPAVAKAPSPALMHCAFAFPPRYLMLNGAAALTGGLHTTPA